MQQSNFPEGKQGGTNRPFRHIFNVLSFGCMMVVVIGILVACGSTPATTASNSKIVITEMDYWSIASQSSTLSKLFSDYEKLHPNVTIQRDAVPFGDLLPKADQEAASHTLPNLLALDNPDVANFAATGALTQLDSFMQGIYNPSDFYAGPQQTMQYQGKTYSFPVGNNDLALFYNVKTLAAAHLTPPTTWS